MKQEPLPNLVIETDINSPTLNKIPICAAMGVSEVWLYKGDKVAFYKLYSGVFRKAATLPCFIFSGQSNSK